MPSSGPKASGAYRTIGELSEETGIAAHILRYWETRFTQLRPLTRAGGRRYYRPEDIALVRRIDTLLNQEGYTIRGVQQVLAGGEATVAGEMATPVSEPARPPVEQLRAIRDGLARGLREDGA